MPFGRHQLRGPPKHPAQRTGLAELRRVAATLLALRHSYPDCDAVNRTALGEHGYPHIADRALLDGRLTDAGWRAAYALTCSAEAVPTPPGEIIKDIGVDAFPGRPTAFESHLLEAA